MNNLNDYVSLRNGEDYQRDNFDQFLKKSSFSFNIPSVHISGSNGKGSTANFIANILMKAGYKVGLFTSPSLIEINESISINHKLISDGEIKNIIKDHEKLIKKYEISSFELLTYIAFMHFLNNECDFCVIECGMGGMVDATNIFTPCVSVITSISLEHTAFLGRTISEIAEQKAGIIKDEIPVVIGDLNEEAVNVIASIAKEHESKLFPVSIPNNVRTIEDGVSFDYQIYKSLKIRNFAHYLVDDACIAIEAILALNGIAHVSEQNIYDGLFEETLPARLQIIHQNPFVILDGSHNPEGCEKLAKSLVYLQNGRKIHIVFACFKDKNLNNMLVALGEVADSITLTTFPHVRAREFSDYFLFVEDYHFIENCMDAIEKTIQEHPDDITVITGSLAFCGYISNLIKNGEIDLETHLSEI